MINPLPSAFVRLWFACSWQYSRREILRAKSQGPASIVKVEAAGDGGTTLTGADGPYYDEAFRADASPMTVRAASNNTAGADMRFPNLGPLFGEN